MTYLLDSGYQKTQVSLVKVGDKFGDNLSLALSGQVGQVIKTLLHAGLECDDGFHALFYPFGGGGSGCQCEGV